MLKAALYNFEGKKTENINLPKEFDVKPNLNLLSQAIHVYEDRAHFGLARAKTRGEVAISTRKIYRQKGTGGARHGAKSAPIFVGGGAAHGPTGIKRILHLTKSQRNKALLYAISYKISDSLIVLADNLEKIKKTKDAANLIKNILKDKNWNDGKNVVIALSNGSPEAFRSFRNIKGVVVDFYKNLNAYKVFLAGGLIIDRKAFEEKKEKSTESITSRTLRHRSGQASRIIRVSRKGSKNITKTKSRRSSASKTGKTSISGKLSRISKTKK